MKVSEITVSLLADYLRIASSELDEATQNQLKVYLKVARKYIEDETGLSSSELDIHPDFAIAVYVLCQDMYDTRTLYVDKNNTNKVVETILGRHRTNLL